MPFYEDENTTREDLEKIRKRSSCAVCGEWLSLFLDAGSGKTFVACHEWPRSHHEGIAREVSRYEKEGIGALNIPTRREIMEQEHGVEKTKALAKYMGGGVVMTRNIAAEIVETLWGAAPGIEKTKCILLCQTYQLNPLMKHIHLIGYKRWKDRKLVVDRDGNPILDWSIQQGIGATRLLAHRKHNYSYMDMTPRRATRVEIDKVFGDEADPNSLYAFVHIKDNDTGAECTACRGIPKNYNVKGLEKGNTRLNQVCIWAERQALDRQYPGEMPSNIEVVDERYMDAEYKVLDKTTGEITEHIAEEAEVIEQPDSEPKKHWCEEHNCAFDLQSKGSSTWYSHGPLPDKSWCYEIKKKGTKAKAAAATAEDTLAEPPVASAGIDNDWLNESLKTIHWPPETATSWIKSEWSDIDTTGGLIKDILPRLNTEQRTAFVHKIEELLELAI